MSVIHHLTCPTVLAVAIAGCASNPPPKTAQNELYLPPVTPAPMVAKEPSPLPAVTQIHIDDAILSACKITEDKAFFAFDSAKIEGRTVPVLIQVANCFLTGPLAGKSMTLIGHADPRGEEEYNMLLGESRAEQVAKYLEQNGMSKSRLSETSRGAMDAEGTDENTWARDRRVDVLLAPCPAFKAC